MESPLTQQSRPGTFEPKIVQLYQQLFSLDHEVEESLPPEGFWRELFLLKPEKQKLYDVLEPLTADQLSHLQVRHSNHFGNTRAEVTLASNKTLLSKSGRGSWLRCLSKK